MGAPDTQTEMAAERTALANERTFLANERTFLAYLRTSMAILAGAVAVIGYVPDRQTASAAGSGLLAVGFATLLGGYLRWRRVDADVRAGRPPRRSVLPSVLTAVLSLTVVVTLGVILALR